MRESAVPLPAHKLLDNDKSKRSTLGLSRKRAYVTNRLAFSGAAEAVPFHRFLIRRLSAGLGRGIFKLRAMKISVNLAQRHQFIVRP
jgi:hypothetical protein